MEHYGYIMGILASEGTHDFFYQRHFFTRFDWFVSDDYVHVGRNYPICSIGPDLKKKLIQRSQRQCA